MGRSGSGKSTLERDLVNNHPDLFHKVVSVTTRPMRPGEQEGVDYKFITNSEYDDLDFYGEMIQTTQFAGNRYGSLYSDYLTPHPYAVLVVTPSSAASFIPVLEEHLPSAEVVVVYFDLSENMIRSNMLIRGDAPEEIEARLAKDNLNQQFEQSGLEADIVITDNTLTPTLANDVISWLMQREQDQE